MHFSGVPCSLFQQYGSWLWLQLSGFGGRLYFVGYLLFWKRTCCTAQEAKMSMVDMRPAGVAVGGRAVYECILSKFWNVECLGSKVSYCYSGAQWVGIVGIVWWVSGLFVINTVPHPPANMCSQPIVCCIPSTISPPSLGQHDADK